MEIAGEQAIWRTSEVFLRGLAVRTSDYFVEATVNLGYSAERKATVARLLEKCALTRLTSATITFATCMAVSGTDVYLGAWNIQEHTSCPGCEERD